MGKAIHWFRQDLRLSDNPALTAATKHGDVLPLFILDDINCKNQSIGAASRCWLHHSLQQLNAELNDSLFIAAGDPLELLTKLIKEHHVEAVYWNRCYESWRIQRDKKIKKTLEELGIVVKSFNGSLLWEPWEIEKKSGGNYKVFTPFYRKGCLQFLPPRKPLKKPTKINFIKKKNASMSIEQLALLPDVLWHERMISHWSVGEKAAVKRLKKFIKEDLSNYKEGRNFPAQQAISRLSPHLHWGEISPNQIWYEIKKLTQNHNTDCFLSELGWREFSYSLLFYYPNLPTKNLQEKFNQFPWKNNKKALIAWQRGQTGYPIVDAGMRELWQTGFMHNRVRMVVASFLIKNLLIDWREGEKWFWDCLVDADLASNSASWQWVAGCGADAAPFFRIFNPVTQGKKFDQTGEYTRHYVPELKNLPDKYLFAPWEAPESVLKEAGICLGEHYPKPLVDLRASRERALEAYKNL